MKATRPFGTAFDGLAFASFDVLFAFAFSSEEVLCFRCCYELCI
jgi:hypothetical protein